LSGESSDRKGDVDGDDGRGEEEGAHAEADGVRHDVGGSHQPSDEADVVGGEEKHQAEGCEVVGHSTCFRYRDDFGIQSHWYHGDELPASRRLARRLARNDRLGEAKPPFDSFGGLSAGKLRTDGKRRVWRKGCGGGALAENFEEAAVGVGPEDGRFVVVRRFGGDGAQFFDEVFVFGEDDPIGAVDGLGVVAWTANLQGFEADVLGGAAGYSVEVEIPVGDVDQKGAVDAHVGLGGDAREVDVHRFGGKQVSGDGVAAEGVED